jgi:histidinol-phosphate/aromatic aminotransferase/cobyric acid decarboxylase-like protein
MRVRPARVDTGRLFRDQRGAAFKTNPNNPFARVILKMRARTCADTEARVTRVLDHAFSAGSALGEGFREMCDDG